MLIIAALVPSLQACSKSRVAKPTKGVVTTAVGVPAPVMTALAPAGLGATVAHAPGAAEQAEQEETDDGSEDVLSITPGIAEGDGPANPGAPPGLSGDPMPSSARMAAPTAGSAQSVLESIADADGMKVFFSTNSIDRGLPSRRVTLVTAGQGERAAMIDEACRQAGLSCFYAADFNSLSVYDPREFHVAGPDMTALVYNRRDGFEAAGASRPAQAEDSRPAKPKPVATKPGKPQKPAKPGKPASAKPGKPAATKPAKPAKPAATKPKPTKPAATKPAAARKPPAAKPKPAAATPAAPVPSRKPAS
ncbi:MAG: hypothetical protein OJI70_10225 [Zavarzinia sp.]|nr:hypothetical protein [Zavarzinia sp.]